MNTKKIAVILIAVAFSLVVIFSGIGILSVKKVQVNYALADETDSQEIQDILEKIYGDNAKKIETLLIKDASSVGAVISIFPLN